MLETAKENKKKYENTRNKKAAFKAEGRTNSQFLLE